MKIETVILSSLVHKENYLKKVAPFLKPEYFHNRADQKVFETISSFYEQYGKAPNYEVLSVTLNDESMDEDLYKTSKEVLTAIRGDIEVEPQWLLDETEKFCKDKAVYNAVLESVKILDEEGSSKDSIPLLLEDALSISFDTNVGHDYIVDAIERYDYLHSDESRLRFDIDMLNEITGGRGIPKKTLTILMAETGAGKSLGLGHLAAGYLTQGLNVLYITLELADKMIGERIDANLLDTPLPELAAADKKTFLKGVRRIAEKTHGRLIIKEYPPASVHAGHFEVLLNELKQKKNFNPDVIMIDYINLALSQRYAGSNHNSYTIVKGAAEEFRALAVKHDVALFSATQINRSGYGNSDAGLENTSESMGLPHTTDLFLALITNEELEKNGHLLIKQLKNRFGDLSHHRRFIIGIDRAKMKWTNVSLEDQNVSNEPEPDPPKFGSKPFKKKDYSAIEA